MLTYRFPGTQTSNDQAVSVGVNHVNIVSISLVQTDLRRVALEKWASRIQPYKTKIQRLKEALSPVILLKFLSSLPTKPET